MITPAALPLLARGAFARFKTAVSVMALNGDGRRIEQPSSVAIDIAGACNLRCRHCYVYRHETSAYAMNRLPELSDEKWVARLQQLKAEEPSIVLAVWVGGEPLLRAKLLKRAAAYFPFNHVFTNGTLPIPTDFPNATVFFVSVDGTMHEHDAIRGAGAYAKVRETISKATSRVFAHTVINRANEGCLERLLAEWQGTRVRGIKVSFHTPEHEVEDPLWLPPAERDAVLDRLERLKRRYGSFLLASKQELQAMRTANQHIVYGTSCLLRRGLHVSLDRNGRVKTPCVMGERADCTRCGCFSPALMYAANRLMDVETSWLQFRTFW